MLDSLPTLRKQLQKIQANSQTQSQSSKVDRYQRRILQLLIRQKTTALQNEQVSQQLRDTKVRLSQKERLHKNYGKEIRQKDSQIQKLREQIQRSMQAIQNLQTQNKMGQIGRINEEQKYLQLQKYTRQVQGQKQKLSTTLQDIRTTNDYLKTQISAMKANHSSQMSQHNQKLSVLINQNNCSSQQNQKHAFQLKAQIQERNSTICTLEQKLHKMELKIKTLNSSQLLMRQSIHQLEEQGKKNQSRIAEGNKQLSLTKMKCKQLQATLNSTQIQRGQNDIQFNKHDKENKKLKKEIGRLEQRKTQIQDQKAQLQEKYQQVQKNYKNTRKQLQKLKESLSQANQFQEGVKGKVNKLQLSLKQYRQVAQQKQQRCQELEEGNREIKGEVESLKGQVIQSRYNCQQTKKKYDVVCQARNIAEEKLVLQRQQNSKSLSSIIREKDLCYRQNYKLLQLLQLKDKTLEHIFNGLKSNQEFEKDLILEISSKQNHSKLIIDQALHRDIKSHKERVKVVEQKLKKLKV